MRLRLLAAAAVAMLGIGITAGNASTITCTFINNDKQSSTYTLEVSGVSACGLAGNDSASALGSIPGVFEAPPAWTLGSKTDEPAAGDKSIVLSLTGGSKGGMWSISSFPELTQIAVVLKAGDSFAAFLLSPFISSGTWSLSRDLSHASLYYRSCKAGDPGCGFTPEVIPLPAAGWLLLAGVGGLAAVRRRRKAA